MLFGSCGLTLSHDTCCLQISLKTPTRYDDKLQAFTTGNDKYILKLSLEDATIYISFRKNSFAHQIVIKPRNKVLSWKVSLSLFFLPPGILLQPFTDKDANELNGVEKKTNGVRYVKPKYPQPMKTNQKTSRSP